MPSPFPGIDPFIESPAFWTDFHARFINYWCEAISDALPNEYEAGLGERVYLIKHDPDSRKLVFPDVAVLQDDDPKQNLSTGGVATLEPVTIPLTILEGPRETYIEIIHRPPISKSTCGKSSIQPTTVDVFGIALITPVHYLATFERMRKNGPRKFFNPSTSTKFLSPYSARVTHLSG